MREVSADAKKSNEEAAIKHLEDMRREMKVDEAKWAERINRIKAALLSKWPRLPSRTDLERYREKTAAALEGRSRFLFIVGRGPTGVSVRIISRRSS